MRTCQICGREIKANRGYIAHHGYKRPYWTNGQTASCKGALNPPYEISNNIIPEAIKELDFFILDLEKRIATFKEGKTPIPREKFKQIEVTDPLFMLRLKEFILQLESEIKYIEREKNRLQERFNNWKKVE
jgi:hypothetical protein